MPKGIYHGITFTNILITTKLNTMNFKITTLYYPSGWVAVAQKGLVTFISERHEDEDDAREDVRQQVDAYIYDNIDNL